MKNRNEKYQRGVSLLEVMIAVVILSVGFLSIVKLQTHLVSGNSIAKQRDEATQLAQMKLESLRTFDGIDAANSVIAYENITSGSDVIIGNNTNYSRTWTVTEFQSPHQKSVQMLVSWTDQNNQQQQVNYTTVISGNAPEATGALTMNNAARIRPTGWTVSSAGETDSSIDNTTDTTNNTDRSSNNGNSDNSNSNSGNNNTNSNESSGGNSNPASPDSSSNTIQELTSPTTVTITTSSGETCTRSSLIPSDATINCDTGTSTKQVQASPSVTLTYNNTSGAVTLINGHIVKTISGAFQLDSSPSRRPANIDLSNVMITAVTANGNGGINYCITDAGGTYSCLVNEGWSGKITGKLVASASNPTMGSATICHSAGRFTSVMSSTTNTINLIKTNRACTPPAGVTQTW